MSTPTNLAHERGYILWVGPGGTPSSPVSEAFAAKGWSLLDASDVDAAVRAIDTTQVVAVVLETGAGIDAHALREIASGGPIVPIVAVADDGEDDLLRSGATAVVPVSQSATEVVTVVETALRNLASVEAPPEPRATGDLLIGESDLRRRVSDLVSRAAPLLATVLIRGETGTGKDLVARALHRQSPHHAGPFVKVHCNAIPEPLLESELFGYEKGAFTGAGARKPGRVELANGGTLFLDEIGDITPSTQVKLLRLLQDREYERLGGVHTLKATARFVAATHRDLEGMMKKGAFREDLFYRLNVVSLWMPPLRARREDIPLLADAFLRNFRETHGKPGVTLDPSAVQALRAQRWPGNVRQLQNFVERLVVLGTGVLSSADVERELDDQVQFKTQLTSGNDAQRPPPPAAAGDSLPVRAPESLADALRVAERGALERALLHANGNRSVAARILGISRGTLYNRLNDHDLNR